MIKITLIDLHAPAPILLNRPAGILLVSSGDGVLKASDQCQATLKANRAFFLRAETGVYLEGLSLTGYLLQFQLAMLDCFFLQNRNHLDRGLFKKDCLLPFADTKGASFSDGLLQQLIHDLERKTPVPVLQPYLYLFFKHVNRDVEESMQVKTNSMQLFDRLVVLIANNYLEHRDTFFYADQLGMNPQQLNGFAVKMSGKKVFSMVMERVFVQADLLLLDHSIPFKEIAELLNFSHYAHFYTYYVKYRGITPAEYRRSRSN